MRGSRNGEKTRTQVEAGAPSPCRHHPAHPELTPRVRWKEVNKAEGRESNLVSIEEESAGATTFVGQVVLSDLRPPFSNTRPPR